MRFFPAIAFVSLAAALLLLGCVSTQPQAQANASVSAGPQATAAATALPYLGQDKILTADPVYLGGLNILTKTGAESRVKVSVRNGSLFFQDFFTPLINASSRAVTNMSQPSIIAFNIIANGSDLYDGTIVMETDLPARNQSTSFVFVDMYPTENVYVKKGQTLEVAGHLSSGRPLYMNYSKVPSKEAFVVFIIFFPTSSAEPTGADFDRFYAANKGWRSVKFMHETPAGKSLIAEIKLLLE